MADGQELDDEFIFSADIDATGYNNKIDAMTAKLQAAQKETDLAAAEVRDFERAIKQNEKAIDALEKKISALDRTSKTYRQDLQAINTQADNLRKGHIALTGGYEDAEKALKAAKVQTAEYGKAVTALNRDQRFLQQGVKDFTSTSRVAGQVVNNLRGHVVSLAGGLITGFAGGLIATAIPAITEWIQKLIETNNETEEAANRRRTLTEVFTAAAKSVGDDAAKLEVYRKKLNDTNIPAQERVKIAKEYNKTAEETNKIDTTQINNLELINAQIEKQNQLIIARAVSAAALAKLTEASTALVEAQLRLGQSLQDNSTTEQAVNAAVAANANQNIRIRDQQTQSLDNYTASLDRNTRRNTANLTQAQLDIAKLISIRNSAQEELNRQSNILIPLITPEGLTTQTRGRAVRQIENIYEQLLRELMARLRAATRDEFQSEELIVTELSNKLADELEKISKNVKEGKLTQAQGLTLQSILNEIYFANQEKDIQEFRAKAKAAFDLVNAAILEAQQDAAARNIENIQEDLTREGEQLQNRYTLTVNALLKRRDELLKRLQTEMRKGLISQEQGAEQRSLIQQAFDQIIGATTERNRQDQLNLQIQRMQQGLDSVLAEFNEFQTANVELTTRRLQQEQARYLAGEISFKKFQKNITQILKDEAEERNALRRNEIIAQQRAIEGQLGITTDPDQRAKLEAQLVALRKQLAELNREVNGGTTGEDPTKKRLDSIAQYAQAIGALAQSVISFWQQSNAAEAAALDRSISLQEQRVESARRVAERGNAEYLQLEEERLRELQLKRENAARRELAINAILQTSQALVAFTSALAQGIATGGPLGGIAIASAVIGLLASGYAIVRSLQPETQSFYAGTKDVQSKDAPQGRDTVPAMLNRGEAVIPTDTNKAYKDSVAAIYDRSVPPEVLNRFVNQYRRGALPGVDYDAVGEAATAHIGADGRMHAIMLENNRKLDEQNSTLRRMNKQLSKLGVSVSLDQNGFALHMVEAARQITLAKLT